MDSFKIVLAILLAIIVSTIQCASHNIKKEELDSNAETIDNIPKIPFHGHHMKKRFRLKTKIPPDYLIPPLKRNYGIFNNLDLKPQVVNIYHTPPEALIKKEKQPTLNNTKEDVSQEPVQSGSINQYLFTPNLNQPPEQQQEIVENLNQSLEQQEIEENLNKNEEKPTNLLVNQVQENPIPEEIVLKKVPQVQLISEISSSNLGTSTLSNQDSDLLKLIAGIKSASSTEKPEISPKDEKIKRIEIGYKIPMPLAASLLGTAGILKGHLGNNNRHERLLHEPIPFFGGNNYPHSVPHELATQIRLQGDSYGPAFNPLYKEPFPGFLPVRIGPNFQYIEFPIEMYKTKFDPVPVSDNVYVNHHLGIGQKAGHIFPVKGSQKVFGYTRSARFIGNLINH